MYTLLPRCYLWLPQIRANFQQQTALVKQLEESLANEQSRHRIDVSELEGMQDSMMAEIDSAALREREMANTVGKLQVCSATLSTHLPICLCSVSLYPSMILMRICLCTVSDSSYSHSHTLAITCTCCYDEIKRTQDLKIYSHADSLILSTHR